MSEKVYVREQNQSLSRYLSKCFGLMAAGILVTAIIAFASYISGAWMLMYTNSFVRIAFLALELGIVIYLSARLYKMSVKKAYLSYFAYAIVSGYTFGSYGVVYDLGTIGIAFLFTAVLFVNMAIIGGTTKRDLTKYGSLLMVGLLTLLVTSIMGLILNVEFMTMVMSYIGIAIFLCITAYDTQMIKRNYEYCAGDEELLSRMTIYSALNLYLDFVNIFLYILRLFGKKD